MRRTQYGVIFLSQRPGHSLHARLQSLSSLSRTADGTERRAAGGGGGGGGGGHWENVAKAARRHANGDGGAADDEDDDEDEDDEDEDDDEEPFDARGFVAARESEGRPFVQGARRDAFAVTLSWWRDAIFMRHVLNDD